MHTHIPRCPSLSLSLSFIVIGQKFCSNINFFPNMLAPKVCLLFSLLHWNSLKWSSLQMVEIFIVRPLLDTNITGNSKNYWIRKLYWIKETLRDMKMSTITEKAKTRTQILSPGQNSQKSRKLEKSKKNYNILKICLWAKWPKIWGSKQSKLVGRESL